MPDTVMQTETETTFRTQSPIVAKIAAALALAQKNFAPIPKDREVTVQSDRGSYKFKYATMDAIRSATMPALSEQGLALVQGMIERGTNFAVETRLLHSSGEWLANVTPMFVSGRVKDGRQYPPTNQELGSAQTYARRYGLSALLCITADEDDDGNTADGNHIGGERAPFKPGAPGSAGGGTQFRPQKRGPVNMVAEAENDGLVDNTRAKGEMPGKPPAPGKKTAAQKAEEWTKSAIGTIKLPGQHVESLDRWWKDNSTVPPGAKFSPLGWLEQAAPAEYERLQTTFEEVRGNAKQVAA